MTNSTIEYRSQPSEVSMGDQYYDLADLNHFWVHHRFRTFRRISRRLSIIKHGSRVADIGCGHGVLQLQLENSFGLLIDGYDLNHAALINSAASTHPTIFYDINERHADLKGVYDVIFLFDVIEHLADPTFFLDSVQYHLKPDGFLVVNVPAEQWLFSRYDKVMGHFRRYTRKSLNNTLKASGFKPLVCSYWGSVYIPLLLSRKFLLSVQPARSDAEIINSGFKPPSQTVNSIISFLSRFDPFPNYIAGSSLMGVYVNEKS